MRSRPPIFAGIACILIALGPSSLIAHQGTSATIELKPLNMQVQERLIGAGNVLWTSW